MPRIRALLIDLDQTLGADADSTQLSLKRVTPMIRSKYTHLEPDRITTMYNDINNWHWRNFDDSPIRDIQSPEETRIHIWNDVLKELGIPDAELLRLITPVFQQEREKTYRCYDDSIPFLQTLHGTMPIVMITNGNSLMQRGKIENCGLTPYLDAIINAQEVGISKPEKEIFVKALEAVSVPASDALMVGDNAEKDILGANGAGIRTAWIRRDKDHDKFPGIQADYQIHSMKEVLEIIERERD